MTETLGDAMPKAIAMVSEFIGKQEAQAAKMEAMIAGGGDGIRLVANVMRVKRDMAVAALRSGDVVAMARAYADLEPAIELANLEDEDSL